LEPEQNLNESLDNILGLLRRRRWWVLLPVGITTFATLFALSWIPNEYRSEAMLLVVQQQIPQRYVLPTSTTDIRDALQATTDEVLSRTRLLQVLDEFGLYAKERKGTSPEAVLDRMRHDIEIKPENNSSQRDVNSFRISFRANNPKLAQDVTSRLTSLFIEQNSETREHQATTTTNFLHERLELTKSKLAAAEEQVRQFKMEHLGELPEQQQGNLAILGGMQVQLQNTLSGLGRAREQRQYLESLSGYRSLTVESDLTRLKSERAELLERYTPQYPAVAKINEKILEKEALLTKLRGGGAAGAASSIPMAVGEDISMAQLRGQLQSNRLEIENLSKDEKELKAAIARYQTRLNQTPVREQQIAGIMRNYELLKLDYADLLNKEMQSQMAGDLEKRKQGEQFRVIDRPSLPTIPSSPNRIKFGLGGAAGGILLGLALAFVVDFRNVSFHSEKEVSDQLAIPLVIGVPLLLTPAEQRAQGRKLTLEWVAGASLTLAVVVAEFYEFYVYRHG
jgi:polysaccharide biosynthesis transport protein